MLKRISGRIVILSLLMTCFSISAHCQATGSSTPYSVFGLGDMSNPGSAYHKTMGGTGIASRNTRFMNLLNPASVTARDSLSFMVDVSVYSDNKLFRQGDYKSASNVFNINDLAMSFPMWKSTAMMIGIMPYSDTGFGYSDVVTDPSIIGHTGNFGFMAKGSGSIYKGFAAAGVTLWKRLSIGAQADYYFGKIEKSYVTSFVDNSFNGVESSTRINIGSFGGKFGLQYEQPVSSNMVIGAGVTYSTGAKLKGEVENKTFSSGSAASDTLYYNLSSLADTKARIAGEIGLGLSFRYADQWTLEFDYSRSDWKDSGIDAIKGMSVNGNMFTTSVSDSYRLGFEIVPNRNDIRYYMKQVAYRAGAYYRNEYYLCNGQQINSKGITIGATFPVFRWSNGLTVGMDFGERGSLKGNLIRERYINFSIGVNLYDIWFQKTEYL